MKIDDMVCALLNEPSVQDDNGVVFTDKALELIHEISEKCKDIPIVKENQKQMEEYADGLSAKEIYVDMLFKIAEAPTLIHMKMVVRVLIPVIDQKLKEETYGIK